MAKKSAVGINNGNFRGGAYRQFDKLDLTSPRDDVLNSLKAYMGDDFQPFWDDLYSRYRWSDTKKYERILRNILALYEQAEEYYCDHDELVMLRRLHKSYWIGQPDELEKLRAVHEKWLHPARSDRENYTQQTVYWNGDI